MPANHVRPSHVTERSNLNLGSRFQWAEAKGTKKQQRVPASGDANLCHTVMGWSESRQMIGFVEALPCSDVVDDLARVVYGSVNLLAVAEHRRELRCRGK